MAPLVRLASALIVAAMVVCTAGCTHADTPVTLPDQSLVCDVFPPDHIAAMLPAGAYTFHKSPGSRNDHIFYSSDGNFSEGECFLQNTSATYGGLLVLVTYNRAKAGEPVENASEDLSATCDADGLNNLRLPRVGQMLANGSCKGADSSGPYWRAWALYWGGEYGANHQQAGTLIYVDLSPKKGRDGAADAEAVVQMMLDFIDSSGAASHPDKKLSQSPGSDRSPTQQPEPQPS